MEFLPSIIDSISVVGVNDEDDALGVGVVMPPQLSDLILATDVPNMERDVLVGHLLDIEANGGDWSDNLTELELVEDGGLSGCVETDHEDSHLLVSEHSSPDLGKHASHC